MAATAPAHTDELAYVCAFVDPSLKAELERVARERDRSMSAELRIALRRHVQLAAA